MGYSIQSYVFESGNCSFIKHLYLLNTYYFAASAAVTVTCDNFFNFSDLDSEVNDTYSIG